MRACIRAIAIGMIAMAGCGVAVSPPWPSARPSPAPPLDDGAITAAIQRELARDAALLGSALAVQTTGGVALLRGSVPHRLAAERAAVVAGEVRGVRRVVARITLLVPPRADAELTDELSTVLPRSIGIVDGKVEGGRAILEGTVGSDVERELAERVAKRIPGVTAVVDRLTIHAGPRSDAEIAVDVRRQLRWDPRVNDAYVAVSVENGVVTLSGGVGSRTERRQAVANARVRGVRQVDADTLVVHWWLENEWLREPTTPVRSYAARRDQVRPLAVGSSVTTASGPVTRNVNDSVKKR